MRKRFGVGLFMIAALGLATSPGAAQVRQGVVQQAEAPQTWGEDGWRSALRGGQWLRTGLFRSFPDPANRHLFDLYENGRFTKRMDISDRRWHVEMPAAHFAAASDIS